jgi:hypothetical protein
MCFRAAGSLLALSGSLGGVTRVVFAALILAACTSTIVPGTVWKTVVPRQVTRTDQVGNVLSPVTDAPGTGHWNIPVASIRTLVT